MRISAKIVTKYIPKNGAAVLNLHVHLLEDVFIKVGQYITLDAKDLDSVEIHEIKSIPLPYYNKS